MSTFDTNWAGRDCLVLGLGETGLAMCKWLLRQGARPRVADSRAAPPGAAALRAAMPQVSITCGEFAPGLLGTADLLALSPGVPRSASPVVEALRRGVPVFGDVELFARALRARHATAPVLAITGSNGKTTVTSLTGALCRAAGVDCEVAGNISPGVLDALMARDDAESTPQAWVLELSSFQLESTTSLEPAAATVLNLSEDHLDRYAGMPDYAAAKARIYASARCQVVNRDDAACWAMLQPERPHLSFGLDAPQRAEDFGLLQRGAVDYLAQGEHPLLATNELRLVGRHNQANALAALALGAAIDLPLAPMLCALRDFNGLPHRMQQVALLRGVSFIDDSKGTNVGATEAALRGLPGKAVLIAGGDGKGQDFTPLAGAVAAHARAVVLIGRDAERIAAAIDGRGVAILRAPSLAAAVTTAFELALPGDAVLLSPACASFDMFRNYAHRAEVFTAAVHALEAVV
jgi:UDP-N-acetylmuramoylalanine--D-glutamate ligase